MKKQGSTKAETKQHHCSLLCQPNTACLSRFSASQALKKSRVSLSSAKQALPIDKALVMALVKQQITTNGFALVSLQSKVNKNSLTGRP